MQKYLSIPAALLLGMLGLSVVSCKQPASDYKTVLKFHPGDESKINEAFLAIKDSTLIEFDEGTYKFDKLSITHVSHISLKGAGHDKTIFDFAGQTQGGEGLRITDVTGFRIEGIKLQDSKGDLMKINKSSNVVIYDLYAVWKTADSTSGGYAIYPVLCQNVLIENSYAEGASDAGIYVGQTKGAIVRNCKAFRNVAGCEIENTSDALVYDNEFYGNTAGFLIFDLPGLSQRGGKVKAYNNYIHDNNHRNFARSGSFGTFWGVGNSAPGSGIIVLATSEIEIYKNRIINNNSSAITMASGLATDDKALEKINDHYFPISKNISIHDNEMQMGEAFPEPAYEHHMGKLLVGVEQKLQQQDSTRKNKRIPLILYDGITTNLLTKGTQLNPDSICIRQTGENIFVDADLLHINTGSWRPTTQIGPFTCK